MATLMSPKSRISAKRTKTSTSNMKRLFSTSFPIPVSAPLEVIRVYDERKANFKQDPSNPIFFDIEEAHDYSKTVPSNKDVQILIYPGTYHIRRTIVVDRKTRILGYEPYDRREENIKPVVFSKNTLMFEFIDGSTNSSITNVICQMSTDPLNFSPLEWIPIVRTWEENIRIVNCEFYMEDDEKFLGISVEKGSANMKNLLFNGGSTGVFMNEKTKGELDDTTISDCTSALVIQKDVCLNAHQCHFDAKQYGVTSNGGTGALRKSTLNGTVSGLYQAAYSTLGLIDCNVQGGQIAAFFKDGLGYIRRCEFHAGTKYTLSGIGIHTNPTFYNCTFAMEHRKSINRVNCPRFRFPYRDKNTFITKNWNEFSEKLMDKIEDEITYIPAAIKPRLVQQANEFLRQEQIEAARKQATMPEFNLANYR